MRIPMIAGNWKMHKTVGEALELVRGIKALVPFPGEVEVVVAPSFTALPAVCAECKESYIGVAAQNCHFEEQGAFTGEVSLAQLKDIQCEYVIIGHSERRQYFAETDSGVNQKTKACMKHGLTPIVCVGEMLAERESDRTFEVIESQLGNGLPNMQADEAQKLVIAYEPVWAIGTGKTATNSQAQEVHQFIRNFLANLYGGETAQKIRLLYGGSVKPENAKELLAEDDIDGALVGGASLKADGFAKIIKAAV